MAFDTGDYPYGGGDEGDEGGEILGGDSRNAYEVFWRWVLDTYGYWSWEYARLPHWTGKWRESDLYTEWLNQGHPGWDSDSDTAIIDGESYTFNPESGELEKFVEPEAPTYEEIVADKTLSLEEKYALIKQNYPSKLAHWLGTPTYYLDEKGKEVYAGGGLDYVYQYGSYDEKTGVYTVDGLELVYDQMGNLIPATPGEEPPPTAVETYYDNNGKVWGYKLDDGAYVASDGVSPATYEQIQQWVNNANEKIAKGEETEPDVADTKIVSIGGYDYEIHYDAEGNEISRRLIGKTEEPEAEDLIPPGYTRNVAGYYTAPDGSLWIVDEGQLVPITREQADILERLLEQELAKGEPTTGVKGLPEGSQAAGPSGLFYVVDPVTGELQYYSVYDGIAYKISEEQAQIIIDDWERGLTPQVEEITPYEREQLILQERELDLLEQQLRQQGLDAEADRVLAYRQMLAGMLAKPISWLEYAAASGTQAAIQPWMPPLSAGEYGLPGGKTYELEAGAPLVGWGPEWESYYGVGGVPPSGTIPPGGAPGGVPPGSATGAGDRGWVEVPGGKNQTGGLPYDRTNEQIIRGKYYEFLEQLSLQHSGGGYMSPEWFSNLSMQDKNALTQEAERQARDWYNQEYGKEYPVYPGVETPDTQYPLPPEYIPPPEAPPEIPPEELPPEELSTSIGGAMSTSKLPYINGSIFPPNYPIQQMTWQDLGQPVRKPVREPVLASYAYGTNYVPRTGNYRLEQGEAVIPSNLATGNIGGTPTSMKDRSPKNYDWGRPRTDYPSTGGIPQLEQGEAVIPSTQYSSSYSPDPNILDRVQIEEMQFQEHLERRRKKSEIPQLPLLPSEIPQLPLLPGEQMPGYDPSLLPEFLRPSAQYYGRMGPSAQQQHWGYEQARTGAIPEETQWRQWSMAPPAGANIGLRYRR